MYAIIETGGKQYRVSPNSDVRIERVDAEEGDVVSIDKVLLLSRDGSVIVGKPYVEGASVKVRILQNGKDRKVLVFKKKPRKGFQKLQGHRQQFTRIRVEDIIYGG